MARIKYAPGKTPITKEHSGYVFTDGRTAPTLRIAARNDRARQRNQINRKLNLMQAVTNWRNLADVQQTAWNNFAAAYPQPTKRNPLKFLSGYQNFIKRQCYLFLNENIDEAWLIPPITAPIPTLSYAVSIDQIDNCVDVTAPYLNAFGLLPDPGDYLILKVIAMATATGQFFEPVTSIVQVHSVYIDGLFLSLSFSGSIPDCTFSVFLSKPVHVSANVNQFKSRYMGCFTSKKFIQLTDCPASYVGQSGKVATVKATEDGLEFKTPSSGGLTCADLVNCPTIISMINSDSNIQALLIAANLLSPTSIGGYGALYNRIAAKHALFPIPGWHLPSTAEYNTLSNSLGGYIVAGGHMKEAGFNHWQPQNVGADNTSTLAFIGSGFRSPINGNFLYFKQYCIFWDANQVGSQYNEPYVEYGSAVFSANGLTDYVNFGCSIRLIKDNSVNTGTVTDYDGNIYTTVKIGSQVWLGSHYKNTHLSDGTLIPNVTDATLWTTGNTPKLCYPANNIALR